MSHLEEIEKLKEEAGLVVQDATKRNEWRCVEHEVLALISRAVSLGGKFVRDRMSEKEMPKWVGCLEERCKDRTCSTCKDAAMQADGDKQWLVKAASQALSELENPKNLV